MKRREAIQKAAWISGVTLTAPLMTTLLQGCKPSGAPGWTSQVLDESQVQALQTYGDLLFPATDTPGASALQVPEMVDLFLTDCISQKQREEIAGALTMIDARATELAGKPLHRLSPEEQSDVLKQIEAGIYGENASADPGYIALKSTTMLAYFTSEPIMKNVLNYNPLPGRFDGCIPIDESDAVFVDNNV